MLHIVTVKHMNERETGYMSGTKEEADRYIDELLLELDEKGYKLERTIATGDIYVKGFWLWEERILISRNVFGLEKEDV